MEKTKSDFRIWIAEHKNQLIFAGISVAVIVGIIIGIKNKDAITELWSTLEKTIKRVPENATVNAPIQQLDITIPEIVMQPRSYTLPQVPFDINQHIRTLPAGRQHSIEKTSEAAALGITLLPNQTLVDSYTKGGMAA